MCNPYQFPGSLGRRLSDQLCDTLFRNHVFNRCPRQTDRRTRLKRRGNLGIFTVSGGRFQNYDGFTLQVGRRSRSKIAQASQPAVLLSFQELRISLSHQIDFHGVVDCRHFMLAVYRSRVQNILAAVDFQAQIMIRPFK